MTMNDGFNLKTLFPRPNEEDLLLYYITGDEIILSIFIIFTCIVGLVGNGKTIWLLGFRIKRKPFATYILNLAIADFGSLVFLLPLNILINPPFLKIHLKFPIVLAKLWTALFVSMFSGRRLLLTAISVDRWVSVLFPNWYQRHRSPVLFAILCVFIWALSFGLMGVPFFLLSVDLLQDDYELVVGLGAVVTFLFCLLLVIVSTLTLFIKVCLKSPRFQCRNHWKVILLILLSFLVFILLPFATFVVVHTEIKVVYFGLWISLEVSVSPLIYFLAGRQNDGQFDERMKVVLQRVFKEERNTRMELRPQTQTAL